MPRGLGSIESDSLCFVGIKTMLLAALHGWRLQLEVFGFKVGEYQTNKPGSYSVRVNS